MAASTLQFYVHNNVGWNSEMMMFSFDLVAAVISKYLRRQSNKSFENATVSRESSTTIGFHFTTIRSNHEISSINCGQEKEFHFILLLLLNYDYVWIVVLVE